MVMLTLLSSIDGEWKLSKDIRTREGKGRMADGKEVYEGTWVNDQMEGAGKIVFASNDSYEGDFRANEFHGQVLGKYV